MPGVLKDKVAIITGGGRGLGKAFALKYAEEGARLLLPDVGLKQAEETAAEIKAKGGKAAAIMTDVSDEKATQKMAEEAMKLYGQIDILVNNAGIWAGLNITPWDAWKVEDWERILKVNVIGTWLCCKAVAPFMTKAKQGKIINIASNVPQVPAAQVFLPYACSKGTIYTFTHAMARALGGANINVNAIAPGYTTTAASLDQRDSEGTFKLATAEQAFQRREEPQDLLGAAVFLASAASDFITGQVLYVDGGTVML
ncbi:MAG: SDR family oxidoreductase [Dehalococcoidales bacterium]|jgi:NAD(P)-dependent dehydrogenase (short-subunit alcohol dehydrogenase family)